MSARYVSTRRYLLLIGIANIGSTCFYSVKGHEPAEKIAKWVQSECKRHLVLVGICS